MKSVFFPNIIQHLPEPDIPFPGLKSWLLQGEDQQVLFMQFEQDVEVPEHAHEAQWGVVLDGIMELTVEGKITTLRNGDSYFIRPGQKHSARIFAGYKDINLFDQPDRYRAKVL